MRQSFPELAGRLTVPGLRGPVEVLRDGYGVPHIYADTAEDLFVAQGFVHAQDRFYEMDFRRHLSAGRLSELYGESQVETDAYVRTLGWRRVAEQELELLAPSTRRYLDAYAAGVNAYINGRSASELSLEYSLLGLQGLNYTPYEWTAADSVAWLKVMAWDLGANLDQETERAIVTAAVGPGRAANLFPNYPREGYEPILRRGMVVGQGVRPVGPAEPPPARCPIRWPGPDRRGRDVLAEVDRMNDALAPVLGGARPAGGDRLELLGPRRLPDRKRSGPAVQRPPPGHLRSRRCSPRWGCTAGRFSDACPLRRRRLQPGLGAGCGDRPQRRDRLGADHQPSRRPGPLSGGGAGRPRPGG